MGIHNIKICTSSCSEEVSGGCGNLKRTLDVTNNKSRYYSDLAKKYMELAKTAKEEAQYYAEQNSDVTKVYVNNIKNELLDKINLRQPAGNYALRSELPINVSELLNDSGYLTLQTALTNLASNDLSNLSADGQALMDNKSDVSIMNLTTLGNARLQYAPFAINAGTVINEKNHTLTSGAFLKTYSEAGTYTIEISEAGNYEVEMYGAGGGMAGNAASASWFCGGGGSGAGFKGIVTLPVGNYDITIGAGGARNAAYNTATRTGGAGTATTFSNLVTCGGGAGGYASGGTRRGGAGGTITVDSSLVIVSQTLASDGNIGDAAASSGVYGGISLQDGTHTGAGAGGGYSNDAVDGFFKITKVTGDASKIFCDPCTITTCDGRTKVYANSASYDVSDQADGDYSVFKDYETGNLSLIKDFGISKALPINVNIIGSLTNNNGVLSGFSTSNYAQIVQQVPLASANSFEFVTKFTYNTSTAMQSIFTERNVAYFSQISINVSGMLYCQLSNNHSSSNIGSVTGSTTLTSGNTYYVKLSFNGSAYKVYLSSTGEFSGEETEEISITSSAKLLNFNWNIGCSALSNYEQSFSQGSIDIKESYINIDGKKWWSGTKPWLNTSTIPANLKDHGAINNDLVYIGDCTISNGGVTDLTNREFNDSGYLIDKSVISAVMPDYSAGVSVSNEYLTTFPCYIVITNPTYGTNHTGLILYIDGVLVKNNAVGGSASKAFNVDCFVDAGHTVKYVGEAPVTMTVYPLKGEN